MINLWKPWFIHRPRQLVLRVVRAVRTPPPVAVLRLPWGLDLEVDPRETIGRAVWTTGVYDLAVTELLYRLTPRGATAVDAGANVGYMAGVLAARAGPMGRVLAIEPNPAVLPRLRANAARFARPGVAPIEVFPVALSETAGTARLVNPVGFEGNQGLGCLASEADGRPAVEVETRALDDLLPTETVDVMKLDVEGHEPAVLRGAARLLAGHRVRHLVFEEHAGPASEAARLLSGHGYELFQVGWRMNGPVLAPLDAPVVCKPYEAPSFLATVAPAEAVEACRRRGWAALAGAAG